MPEEDGIPLMSLVPLKVFYLLKSFFLATVATGLLTGGVVSNPLCLSGPCRPGFPKQ